MEERTPAEPRTVSSGGHARFCDGPSGCNWGASEPSLLLRSMTAMDRFLPFSQVPEDGGAGQTLHGYGTAGGERETRKVKAYGSFAYPKDANVCRRSGIIYL